jgi:hypothetical protein
MAMALIERPEGYTESGRVPSDLTGQTMAKTQKPTAADDGLAEILESGNYALINAVAIGETMKETVPIPKRPQWRELLMPRTAPLKPPARPIPFVALADSGRPAKVAGYPVPLVHDLATLRVSEGPIPVRWKHDGIQCGFVQSFEIRRRGGMVAKGYLVHEWTGCFAGQIENKALAGDLFQCSLATKSKCFEYLPAHQWLDINGGCVQGPLLVSRCARVVELSLVENLRAADRGTYTIFWGTEEFTRHQNCGVTAAELRDERLREAKQLLARWDRVQEQNRELEAARVTRRLEEEVLRRAAFQERLEDQRERRLNRDAWYLGSRTY